jgi:hypothetical protein
MNEPKRTDPNRLKRMALIPIAAGIIAIIVGAVLMKRDSERRDDQSREFMAGRRRFEDLQTGPPDGMFFIIGGVLAIGIGLAMISHANRGKALRSEMKRYLGDPVLREALHEAGSELARGGTRGCSCGASNAPEARFCSQCGQALDAAKRM